MLVLTTLIVRIALLVLVGAVGDDHWPGDCIAKVLFCMGDVFKHQCNWRMGFGWRRGVRCRDRFAQKISSLGLAFCVKEIGLADSRKPMDVSRQAVDKIKETAKCQWPVLSVESY